MISSYYLYLNYQLIIVIIPQVAECNNMIVNKEKFLIALNL